MEIALLDCPVGLERAHFRDQNLYIVIFAVLSNYDFNETVPFHVANIRNFQPEAPILLVGTKSDLRGKNTLHEEKEIDVNRIEEMVRSTGAIGYVECSSVTGRGVRKVLDFALQELLKREELPASHKKACATM